VASNGRVEKNQELGSTMLFCGVGKKRKSTRLKGMLHSIVHEAKKEGEHHTERRKRERRKKKGPPSSASRRGVALRPMPRRTTRKRKKHFSLTKPFDATLLLRSAKEEKK